MDPHRQIMVASTKHIPVVIQPVARPGLVFIGAASDAYLRAFDIETGEELWKDKLPTTANAVPMSYTSGGRQFVVVAAGGHWTSQAPAGDHLIAYALED